MPELDLETIAPAAELTAFAREIPQRADLILTQLILPVRNINNVKYRTRSGSVTVSAAKFRAFNAPTPRLAVQGETKITEGWLPPLGGVQDVEELQTILLELSRGADSTGLVDALYDATALETVAIWARLELAAGELLAEGSIQIEENGFLQEIDFGVPSANKVTPATAWTNPLANRLQDEVAWIQQLADSGFAPGRVLTSRRVIQGFSTNASYKGAYWGVSNAEAATKPALSLEQVNSVRGTYGLPPLLSYDAQVNVDGAMVRTLPENAYVLLPGDATALGSTTFGLTAESLVLSSGSNPRITREDASGIISTASFTDNPVSYQTKTTAVALPILDEARAILIAKVWA